MPTIAELTVKAKAIIESHTADELEDYWESYNEAVDLNIWIDDSGKYRCVAYDVIDNVTQTDHWVTVL